jgi:tRNA pseudouridine38-40 synthase
MPFVRNIAGVLLAVGRGVQNSQWVEDILDKRDRTQGGVTAPASGLYLVGVSYPEKYGIEPLGVVPEFG